MPSALVPVLIVGIAIVVVAAIDDSSGFAPCQSRQDLDDEMSPAMRSDLAYRQGYECVNSMNDFDQASELAGLADEYLVVKYGLKHVLVLIDLHSFDDNPALWNLSKTEHKFAPVNDCCSTES